MYSASELDAEKNPFKCNYGSLMTRTVQLLKHDAYNCTITAQIRAADDQSD